MTGLSDDIRILAERRRRHLALAAREGDALGRLLREAHSEGQTIEQLTRESGYSRRQIYNLMDRKPSK